MFRNKMDAVVHPKQDINYFFFGSSRVATGINPSIFDSLMATHNLRSHSFNMATFATWFSEDEYLFDHFLREANINGAVAFIEFQHVMSVDLGKIDTDKNIYYQNLNNYNFIWRFALARNHRSVKDLFVSIHYVLSYSVSELLYFFNLGKSECIYSNENLKNDYNPQGFTELHTRDSSAIHPGRLQTSINTAFASSVPINTAFSEKIDQMIKMGKERNVKVIFILTANDYTKDMVAVYKDISPEHRINYTEFLKFDDLYKRSLWADNTHLNERGASLYTRFIVDDYLRATRQ